MQAGEMSPLEYVNPFICTAGDHGQLDPGATMPFGLVKLCADTYPSGFNGKAHAGYNYDDKRIMGFSHVRVGGVGCEGVGGNILVKPGVGHVDIRPEHYSVIYDKKSESASPGYYKVILGNPAITVELAVTEHVGLHRYTFPKSKTAYIFFDLRRAFTRILRAVCTVVGDNEVAGEISCTNVCDNGKYTIYFSALLSRSFDSFSTWNEEKEYKGVREQSGTNLAAHATLATSENESVLVKVGLSSIDVDGARQDRESEIPGWNFDYVRNEAQAAWDEILSKIEVEGDEEYKMLFYTHLYHAYLIPVNATSSSGRYRGTDKLVHKAEGYTYYNSYTLWDTYRSKYPLFTITEPERMQDIAQSLTDLYKQRKSFGATGFWPVPSVRTEHTIPILLDAYRKGLRSFDFQAAYDGMRKEALKQLPEDLERPGYVPNRVDHTLEYAYNDWCIAQMAKELNEEADYQKFMQRAGFYKNIWHSIHNLFLARDEKGDWLAFPNPEEVGKYAYEGSLWHWMWFVPHDIQGLITLLGGRDKFLQRLRYFFESDLYNHGNEPDLQAAYLFDFAGAPWLTQKYVRKILTQPMRQKYGTHGFLKEVVDERIYKITPDGYLLEMDDDGGTMSSWFVLSAIGFFPVCVGEPVYEIGTPIFEKVVIHLDSKTYTGKRFVITAKDISPSNIFIQSATLNGKEFNQPWIHHKQIVAGGELIFQMGSEPDTKWGTSPSLAPPSMSRQQLRQEEIK